MQQLHMKPPLKRSVQRVYGMGPTCAIM